MKLEELMVGDIIFQHHPKDNTPHIVKVSVDTLDLMDKMKIGFIQEQSPLYRIIEPIPLTPEILEKNGFKGEVYAILKLDEHSWLEYYYHKHRLRKYWSGIDEWQNHSEVKDLTFQCHCNYVHELQHALKLCGIEKTIEL